MSKLGVDVSRLFPTSAYKCLKKAGYTFVVVRGYNADGSLNQYAVQSLKNSRKAGMANDVYILSSS